MMPVTNYMLEYAQNFVSDARRCMVFPPLCLFRPIAPAYGSGLLLQFTSQQGDAGIDKEQ